jgi:hypothetical protein
MQILLYTILIYSSIVVSHHFLCYNIDIFLIFYNFTKKGVIKIKKFITMMVFMVFSIFSFSASTDLDMKTLGAKLSTVKGTGTYKTYLEIKGF